MRLSGKTALVTGAGRGIGRSIALKLAAEGANLVLNELDEKPGVEVVAEIAGRGRKQTNRPGSAAPPTSPALSRLDIKPTGG